MLSCGKVIRQLSKITRHTHGNHLEGPLKYVGVRNSIVCNFNTYDASFPIGIISIESSRYNSTKEKKPYRFSGATLKAEECVPQSPETKKKFAGPACELGPDPSCPSTCPGVNFTKCPEVGGQSSDGSQGNKPFKYWKELLIALLVTGAVILSISQLRKDKSDSSTTEKEKDGKEHRRKRAVKNPSKSNAIPPHIPYLLIGGGPASFSAFRSIKSRDPKAKVLIVTDESYNPYMKPPLSKEVWYDKERKSSTQFSFKQWHGTPRSFFYEPPEFFTPVDKLNELENGGVSVANGWKVTEVDVINKIATLHDGYQIKYDKCLLATGSSPRNLELFDSADDEVKSKILPYRSLDDFLELEGNVHSPDIHNIVIIGGGFLGSELACSLAQNLDLQKKKVFQICKEKFIMAQVLPEYLSEWTTNKAENIGVNCLCNTEVKDFEIRNGKLALMLSGNRVIEADQVIVAIGAEANTQLANTSELETDPETGGYLVNAELEARSNLWIAGDAASFYDIKFGRRRVEHYDNAVVSGRLAGENMTGAGKPYKHQSMFWSDLGLDIGYEAIGIIDSKLPTVGVFLKDGDKKKKEAVIKPVLKTEEVSQELERAEIESSSNQKSESQNIQEVDLQNPESIFKPEEECKSPEEETVVSVRKNFDFDKGVIFYLRNDIVVGVILWNLFNRMSIARQVLARDTKYDELTEVSKWFTIHED